ncbi:hypothetical protein I4U23_020295 [Adineta vaga]|nr:hypothetical protein I4U23_020295 [Adineta vaga]
MHLFHIGTGLLITLICCSCDYSSPSTDTMNSSEVNSSLTTPIVKNTTTVHETSFTTNDLTTGGNVTMENEPPSSKNKLPLILGLSLGLGIPILALLLVISICCYKKRPSASNVSNRHVF